MSRAAASPVSAAPSRRQPQRTCVSCRATVDKRDLIRIVRTANHRVAPDPSGKAPGRGAYLCTNFACWENAAKTGLLDRALRTSVSQSDAKQIIEYGREMDERVTR